MKYPNKHGYKKVGRHAGKLGNRQRAAWIKPTPKEEAWSPFAQSERIKTTPKE